MIIFPDIFSPKLVEHIAAGAIGVLKTDTQYGIVARSDNQEAVERVFAVKHRTPTKPPIVLISRVEQMYDPLPDGIDPSVGDLWPGPNSVIVPAPSAPEWLVRGSLGVAYRLPADERLRALIDQTGPLIAPSANPEGMTPARTVAEAEGYFGEQVDFYVDGGVVLENVPSNLFSLTPAGDIEQLR